MRTLTPEAYSEWKDWKSEYESCSCHLHPPCPSCTHPGHPLNLEGDDGAWEEVE